MEEMIQIMIFQRPIFREPMCISVADFPCGPNILKMINSLFHKSKELGKVWPWECIEVTVDVNLPSLKDFLDDPRTLLVVPLS